MATTNTVVLTDTAKDQLYQFFAIAFDAAPGVTYMSQLADAYLAGMTVPQIVEAFTTKPQFTAVYPSFLTNKQFADRLVENVVGTSASGDAKTQAKEDVEAALSAGWTRGKVVYQVFVNLGAEGALNDSTWGGTAALLQKQIAYAKYFTEDLSVDTTDLKTLQAVISAADKATGTVESNVGQVLNPTYDLAIRNADASSVSEGNAGTRFMPFQLELSAAPTSDVVVGYSITGGTATSGEDYQDTSGTITFAAGQRTATVNVPVIGDRLAEVNETVQLTFTGSRLNASLVATGAIKNDDAAPSFTSATTFTVGENGTAVGAVAALDQEGDPLNFSIVGGPDGGLFSVNATTGVLSFKAAPNFEKPGDAGSDNTYNLTISVGDGTGNASAQEVAVTVTNQNDAPVANAVAATALTGKMAVIDVLANDTDEDAGDTKTVVSVTEPTQGGVAVINQNGSIDYTAVAFAGEETFTYTMKDSKGVQSSATVTVTVSPNITSTDGNDVLYGTAGAEKIDGGLGDDTLYGGGGADSLIGNEGNDSILYRDSAALIQGGNGTDTLVIDASALGAKFDLASAINQVTDESVVDKGNLVVRGMDNIDATASSNAITLESAAAGTTLLKLTSQADTVTTMAAVTGNLTVVAGSGDDDITSGAVVATATMNIDAGDGNDKVNTSGSDAEVTISGGAGKDTISSGSGNDEISGGDGDDTVNAGIGNNNVSGGAGNDSLTTAGGADTVSGGDGNDTINAGSGDNSVNAGDGNNSVTTGGDADTVVSGAGNDIISADNGANSVTSGAGDDSVTTGTGADTIDAGDGNDVVNSGAGNDVISAGEGNNTVDAAAGNNAVTAGAGNDTIIVGAGDSTVSAGDGADSITAGSGKNSLSAGAGDDTITIGTAEELATNTLVDGGGGTDTLKLTVAANQILTDAQLEKAVGIEALDLTGGGDDEVILEANANASGLATVKAGAGDDIIVSSSVDYTLNAVIDAGDGFDNVTTGAGYDTVTIGAGDDSATTGDGDDTVVGGANVDANDTLSGEAGTDVLTLNAGSKSNGLTGDTPINKIIFTKNFTGFETITLAAGASAVDQGVDGEDTAASTNSYDITLGDASNVAPDKTLTVDGSALRAGVVVGIGDGDDDGAVANIGENDTNGSETLALNANAIDGAVNVLGGKGDDTVSGSEQADTILGNAGADLITGFGGADSIDAGAGADTLVFASEADLTAAAVVAGGADTDIIKFSAPVVDLTDAAFANVSSVESLITANGVNSVVLGSNAEKAGVLSVTGGIDADVLSVSGYVVSGATLSGLLGNDSLTGSAQGDDLSGGDGKDTLVGGAGDDKLTGGAGQDNVIGGEGNDSISTDGADTVDAGTGNDRVTLGTDAAAADVNVDLFDGNDTVVGGNAVDGNDVLSGGAGTDVLTLNAGSKGGIVGNGTTIDPVISQIIFNGNFTGFETITLAAGVDALDQAEDGNDIAGSTNSYDITLNSDKNVAAGSTMTVDASALRAGVVVGFGDGEDKGSVANIGESTDGVTTNVVRSESLTLMAAAVKGSMNVLGGAGGDTITVGDQADTVASGGGNDTVTTNGGNDSVSAGAGNDDVDTGAGNDTVDGGTGNDSITLSDGADIVMASDGNDTIDGGAGADSLAGGAGDDTFMMTRAQLGNDADTVDGGDGADSVAVDSATDTTIDDVFFGLRFTSVEAVNLNGAGQYTYTAGTYSQGAGIRTITVGSSGASTISVSQYTAGTTITGGSGNDTITGSALADSISGGSGNDSVLAGDGNDTVAGGIGDDYIDAGAGNDTVTTQEADTVLTGTGNDTVTLGVVEAVVDVDLGAGDDTLVGGATVAGTDVLKGGDGTDVLTLNAGSESNGLTGTQATSIITFDKNFTGFETITLAAGASAVNQGEDGKDTAASTNSYAITLGDAINVASGKTLTIDGSALRANEVVKIGDGVDDGTVANIGEADSKGSETLSLTATAVAGSINVTSGAGDDAITLGAGADTVVSGAGNDTVNAGDGANSVTTGSGDDAVTTGTGADTIDTGEGNDNVSAGAGNDSVNAGAGNDAVTAGAGNDVISAGDGNNTVDAGDGNDAVTTGSGSDSIVGGGGNDTISAGDGNDTVNGGTGVDVIDLAGGSDVLVYTAVADSTGVNFDDVSNFTSGTDRLLVTVSDGVSGAGDTLDLSGFAVVPTFADGLVSLSGNATVKVFSDAFYSTGDGKLYVDSNGDGQINQGNDLIVKIASVAAGDLGFAVNAQDGNDNVTGGAGKDAIDGGLGNDTLAGGAGDDALNGDAGADSVTGGDGADTINGGAGNDTLNGGAGNDAISGGVDVDVISGGTGVDTLTGGTEADTFVFAQGDTGLSLATADRVEDFLSGTDKLSLGLAGDAINFNAATAAVAGFDAALTEANKALATLNETDGGAAQLYAFQFDATNGYLFIDRNSDGQADEVVVIVGSVVADDIIGGP